MSAMQSLDTTTVVASTNTIENTEPEQVALVETSEADQDANRDQNVFFDFRRGRGVAYNTFILDIAGFTGPTTISLDGLGEEDEIEIIFVETLATEPGLEPATHGTTPCDARPRN